MALSTKLELRQGQQLVMTPQLQQAIRLLQLSNIELMQYVETELERNPLLEPDESGDTATRSEPEPAEFDTVCAAAVCATTVSTMPFCVTVGSAKVIAAAVALVMSTTVFLSGSVMAPETE